MINNNGVTTALPAPSLPVQAISQLRSKFAQFSSNSGVSDTGNSDIFPPLPVDNTTESTTPENILKELRERLG